MRQLKNYGWECSTCPAMMTTPDLAEREMTYKYHQQGGHLVVVKEVMVRVIDAELLEVKPTEH